ncbi:MAG: secondary thiamine-phosphate synthase enzyme YjbQ [Thermodesulfobacteriota bacterium]|nr:secondary thiamine-phosphate synthase enzyme YjbQ [Thermodesulfobacteriota bacterium]
MAVVIREFKIETAGFNDIHDISPFVSKFVHELPFLEGSVTIFVPGSTAGVTTIEFESGVIEDLKDAFERLIPQTLEYRHNLKWGDGNGFSHVRSALCKASLTVPFVDGKITTGTWQQIVIIDFDNRQRHRRLVFQAMG